MSDSRAGKPSTGRVVAAFAAVYVLWGSTYLGIRFSIETLPPFLTQGVRFTTAGLVMYAWARLSGIRAPSRREWVGGLITGALLFVCGTGAVVCLYPMPRFLSEKCHEVRKSGMMKTIRRFAPAASLSSPKPPWMPEVPHNDSN